MATINKTFLINSPNRTSLSFEQKEDGIYYQVSLINPLLHAYYLYGYLIFVIIIMFFDFYLSVLFLLLMIPLIIFFNMKKKEKHVMDVTNKIGTTIGQLTYDLKEYAYVDLETQKSFVVKTSKYEILYLNEEFKIEYPQSESDYTGFDIVTNEETLAQIYYSPEPDQKGQFLMTLLSENYEIPFVFIVGLIITTGYLK